MSTLLGQDHIEPIFTNTFHLRNDVIIALKKQNPEFFNSYFDFYRNHLEQTHSTYFTPLNDEQAQDLARKITMQTDNKFFQIVSLGSMWVVYARFGNDKYRDVVSSMNCTNFLPYKRVAEFGNTWLPDGECLEEIKELAKLIGNQFELGWLGMPSRSNELIELDELVEELAFNRFLRLPLSMNFIDDDIFSIFNLIINFSTNSNLDSPLLALPAPAEKKLITYPLWDDAKKAFSVPSASLTSLSIFNYNKEFIIQYRHASKLLQSEYDKKFGLIKRPSTGI